MTVLRSVSPKCFNPTKVETLRALNNAWIHKRSVSASRPALEAKIDKETCGKVIEAAETVKDGTQQVVSEVKRVGQAVTKKVANATGHMVADAAQKGFQNASETANSQRSKDAMDTAKTAADALKDKISAANDEK